MMHKLRARYRDMYGIDLRLFPIPWATDSYIVNMYYPDGYLYSDVLKESEILNKTQEDMIKHLKPSVQQ